MNRASIAAYFSHSWKTHLPLNLSIWERLSGNCHLLLDRPIQQIFELKPPYFINRLESLLGRADIFVACLPMAEAPTPDEAARGGDWRLRCSPYILFEIRIAERADRPRFIMYDPRTGFEPPRNPGPHARYVPGRLDEISGRLNEGGAVIDLAAIDDWLNWVARVVSPSAERDLFRAAYLLGGRHAGLEERIGNAVRQAGFDKPVDLADCYRNDAELVETLRMLRLLVVDVSDPEVLPLYQMAHALLVPCIRLHASPTDSTDAHLPAVLRGHRAGYQKDLLGVADGDPFVEAVRERAYSVVEDASPIVGKDPGRYQLQQRGYKKHLVFISHNLKGDGRPFVEGLCTRLRELGIDFWEYEHRNLAGEDWRSNLDNALLRMTHFVALETPTYDQSEMCVKEMKTARDREAKGEVEIRAFRVAERGSPVVELRNENRTHQPLPSSPDGAARLITDNLLNSIRR